MFDFSVPWKQVFTTPTGEMFIRYKSNKVYCLVQVHEFDDANLLNHRHQQFAQYCNEQQMPLVAAQTSFESRQYLLTCNEWVYNYEVADEKGAKALAYRIRKLADWFRYHHLIAEKKKKPMP